MAQTNCRVPEELDAKLEAAADERQAFKSEIIREAIRHYVRRNPDDFRAFSRGSKRNRDVRGRDRDHNQTAADPHGEAEGVYDPTEGEL